MIEWTIKRIEAEGDLSVDQMAETMGEIMEGRCRENDIARFLLALRRKGESVEEIAGAAMALRRHMTQIRSGRTELLDTCGTGGDGSGTFNISTAAAVVVAGAGVAVAKHGNCGITSRSGSADALAALGVNVNAGIACVERCLEELGICFCFAPLLHQSMQRVAAVRKKLGVSTIFNILGPLANPAGANYQLLGVGREDLQPRMAKALALLGTQRAIVVRGADGLDEVTLAESTLAAEVTPTHQRQHVWDPADFDLEPLDLRHLVVSGPQESAAVIRGVFSGQPGPARDIVIANAAAGLWTVRRDPSLRACAALAAEAIDSGAAERTLSRLVELSRSA